MNFLQITGFIITVVVVVVGEDISSAKGQTGRSESGRGTATDREREALRMLERGEHVKAAREFEALWAEHPESPHLLLRAATARRDAGHAAHAVAYQGIYLARVGLDATSRAHVESTFAAARQLLTPVHVAMNLSPRSATEVTIVAERADAPPLTTVVRATRRGAEARLALEPGPWRIRVQAPGLESEVKDVVVTGVPATITLEVWRAGAVPMRASKPRQRSSVLEKRVTRAVLMTGGALGAATGAAIAGVGEWRLLMLTGCEEARVPVHCRISLRDGLRMRETGVLVGGAGLGLLVGGSIWFAPGRIVRRKLWTGQVAVGAALLIAGVATMPAASVRFNVPNRGEIRDWYDHVEMSASMLPHALATGAAGLGLGMVTSGTLSLIVQRGLVRRESRVPRAAAQIGPTGVQLTVSGSF